MSLSSTDHAARDLVDANHILAHLGILDGFGHVSVRHPRDARRFLIARSMAPALVEATDIVECDLAGRVHDPANRASYVERFIHARIYAAREDVHAVVHSHSPGVIPFGVSRARLRPVCHMAGFLGSGAPVFDLRAATGTATDLLVRTCGHGDALATSLGDANVVLMRGHGSVAVGTSVRQAVFRAVYTQLNAQLQQQAHALGEVTFLSLQEAQLASETNDQHLERPWSLWLRQVRAAHSARK